MTYRKMGTLFLVALWAITCVAKYKFNGLMFGFDYGIYQPDGVHYTYKTLTFLGRSPLEAAQEVSSWYQSHSFKMRDIDPLGILPENNGADHLTKSRIVYSLLSVPFVFFFGIPGMLCVPALSLLALMLLPLIFVGQKNTFIISCIMVFSLSISPTVQRWMLVNCTDSLLVGLFSGYFFFLIGKRMDFNKALIIDFLFLALTSFTRFSLPFWIGISLVLLTERRYMRSAFIAVTSILFALPTILIGGSASISPANEDGSIFEKIIVLPVNLGRIVFYEVGQLVALDRGLLLLLLVCVIVSWKTRTIEYSKYFLAFMFAGILIGAINGTIGVNFRYQMPLLVPLVLVLSYASTIKWDVWSKTT